MVIKNKDKTLRIILFVLAFLMYANTIGHDYAWDDKIVIVENARVKKGISGVADLFLKYNSDYRADQYGYRPVALTSFALDHTLYGANAHAGHFMNVLYFSLLCVVLFNVLRRIFYRFSNLAPFLTTLLFAVHPVHVEAVANIKSRDEIFALLFALLSLSRFIAWHQTRKPALLAYSVILYFLAFLSKEGAITFLAILPLTLFYIDGWTNRKKVLVSSWIVPVLLILSVLIIALSGRSTLGTELSKGAGIYHESDLLGNSFFYTSYLLTDKLANAFTLLLLYAKNFFYPVSQLYYYGYNQVPAAGWRQPMVIASFLLFTGGIVLAFVKLKKRPELAYGFFFFLITISMYLHLFKPLSDTMADRFLFTPSVGLSVLTVFMLGLLLKIDLKSQSAEALLGLDGSVAAKPVKTVRYLFLAITLLLAIKTVSRNSAWKNDETLIMRDMPYLENSARANMYYADMLRMKLAAAYNPAMEADMIAHYEKSFHITGESYYARLGLGTYLNSVKRYGESIPVLDSMVASFPRQADPYFYLAQAYYETGRYRDAVSLLDTAIRLAPKVEGSYILLSNVYAKSGDFNKSIATLQQAQQALSESAALYETMGQVYFDKGDLEQSTKATLELLRFGTEPQRVYGIIIGRYQLKKQDGPAAFYYRQAVQKGIFKQGANPR